MYVITELMYFINDIKTRKIVKGYLLFLKYREITLTNPLSFETIKIIL